MTRSLFTGNPVKPLLIAGVTGGLWFGIFFVLYRVLSYFQSIESLGDFLATKLLAMILVVFLSVLLFSNIITALSAFYLSEDLSLILALPTSVSTVYGAKLIETTINSSWMVLLFGSPVFLAYGIVYNTPWSYYGCCLLVFIPFILIASTLATMLVMGLVNIFPARRTRDILFILSILFIVVLYLLIRFLKPESLVNPESFANMIDYLTTLRTFSFPFLPTSWVTEALLPFLQPFHAHTKSDTAFYILLLWSTSLALLIIGDWVCGRIYFNGWSTSQEARRIRFSQTNRFTRLLDMVTSPFSPQMRMIIQKDIKAFFRDATQWSQLLLLLSLIIVYLYNFKALPLDSAPIPGFYLQNLFAFLNLGLAGFVLAAIAARFVYPSVSMEGRAFWIIKSSPLPLQFFVLSKFWLNVVPLLILGLILIVCSNVLLQATDFMMVLSIITIMLLTFGITSLGIGMGALHPRFRYTNVAEIPSGYGGLMYMVAALGLIGLTVALEARPVYLFFSKTFRHIPLTTWSYIEIGLAFIAILIVSISAVWFPLRHGIKNLLIRERFD